MVAIPERVLELQLSRVDLLVYRELLRAASSKGVATASVPTIAERCGKDERSVRRSLRRLQKLSAIRITKARRADGGNDPNRYVLT